jgi:hypothetical protein
MKRLAGIALVLWLTSIFAVGGALGHTETDPFVTDLVAGKTMDVGDVLVWNDADYLYVKYTVMGGWCLDNVNLHIATALADIPQTNSGNPKPGQFDYKADLGCAPETTFVVPLAWAAGTELYIAAKAEISGSPSPERRASYYVPEGAWAEGTGFPGKNWAMYFTYTVQEYLVIGWANLQWPPTLTTEAGTLTEYAYGQVWIDGVTSLPGPTPGLMAQAGFGPEGTVPDGNPDWEWVDAPFNVDAGNNDEFYVRLLPTETGDFDYLYRYSVSGGAQWLYADLDGPIPPGGMPPKPGKLTVTPELRTVTVTFHVAVPATTPADAQVIIAGTLGRLDGSHPDWDPGAVGLTKVGDYEWEITFTGPESRLIEYKYTLGSWDFVEKGATCDEISNRMITLEYGTDGTQEVNDTVLNWRGIPPCEGTVQVTFHVMVPEGTPSDATVYVAGGFHGLNGTYPDWDPAGIALSKVGDYEWRKTLTGPNPTSLEYKYTLGAWDSVEKGSACEEIGNRSVVVTYGSVDVTDTVLNWGGVPPCAGPVQVTFHVTVPEGTPSDATVYIAGSLHGLNDTYPDWDPAGIALSKVGDYEWSVTLSGPDPASLEYKYTLGAWDNVEKGAACEEIGNRSVAVTSGSQDVTDTVLNWGGVPPCGP